MASFLGTTKIKSVGSVEVAGKNTIFLILSKIDIAATEIRGAISCQGPGTSQFTWSFEPYVEFVQYYSMRVLGSKGWAVGRGIGPLTYRPPDCRLPIIGRPPPGTRALDRLLAHGVCHGFSRFALLDEHWAHWPRSCNICNYRCLVAIVI